MDQPIIKVTRQAWKYWTGMCIGVMSLCILFFGDSVKELVFPESQVDLRIGAIIVMIANTLFLFMSIRCPSCRAKRLWLLAVTNKIEELDNTLLKMKACPECGPGTNNDGVPVR